MREIKSLFFALSTAALLTACGAGGNDPGTEYSPNMYHSVAYEPYKQIKDWNAGRWLTSIDYPVPDGMPYDKGHAEFYNSNNFNPFAMNMREPAPNTVPRNAQGWLPYRIPNTDEGLAMASRLENPLPATEEVVAEGKRLYTIYCQHCHGAKGEGDGKVAQGVEVDGKQKSAYGGVANFKSSAYVNITEGHIFHVITYGRNLMWPHGSQISPEDRWKIAKYVKVLQSN